MRTAGAAPAESPGEVGPGTDSEVTRESLAFCSFISTRAAAALTRAAAGMATSATICRSTRGTTESICGVNTH